MRCLSATALSIAVAGSLPQWPTKGWAQRLLSMPEVQRNEQKRRIHDYEQRQERPVYRAVGGFAELYVLGALETGRFQLQILHEHDQCCFRAVGIHDGIRAYNSYVQRHAHGWMQTSVTEGTAHDINPRDRAQIQLVIQALRAGTLSKATFTQLPFNLLANVQNDTTADNNTTAATKTRHLDRLIPARRTEKAEGSFERGVNETETRAHRLA